MDWLHIAIGLLLLVFAGDYLVKGAVNLSLKLGIPAFIVSLTIVAFGTSAPELLISVQSVLEGVPEIAMGNVVGSNIANILLVLGVPAILSGIRTSDCNTKSSYVQMIIVTAVFIGLSQFGVLDWRSGVVLLALLTIMLVHSAYSAKSKIAAPDEADPGLPGYKIALLLILGLIGLPLGADLLVDGATGIARRYGVSEAVIGLTLVAVGTSLPELATTVVAALRKNADVALGNVIGSNIFNLAGIMGLTTFVGAVPVGAQFLTFDLWVMAAAALILLPFVFFHLNITRIWGLALSALYVSYLYLLF